MMAETYAMSYALLDEENRQLVDELRSAANSVSDRAADRIVEISRDFRQSSGGLLAQIRQHSVVCAGEVTS